METTTVGRVLVSAKIENVIDLYAVNRGQIKDDQVHRVEVADALVDTGATLLGMTKQLIDQLGLEQIRNGSSQDDCRNSDFRYLRASAIDDRRAELFVDVSEVADTCPVIIGYVPLELLDFVVDPKGQRLIGNPDHGGEFMFDMY